MAHRFETDLGVGDAHLTGNQQPAPRHLGVHQFAGEQRREFRQKFLQKRLPLVRLLAQLVQLPVRIENEDA